MRITRSLLLEDQTAHSLEKAGVRGVTKEFARTKHRCYQHLKYWSSQEGSKADIPLYHFCHWLPERCSRDFKSGEWRRDSIDTLYGLQVLCCNPTRI